MAELMQVRQAARALGVHENTIRYRLGRIEELSGLAVAHDPDAQLQTRLSLLLLQLQGRIRETPCKTDTALATPRTLEVLAAGRV